MENLKIEGSTKSEKWKNLVNYVIYQFHTPSKEEFMQNIQREDNGENGNFGQPKIPCVYGAWNSDKQLVECSRLLSKKGKIIELSLASCKKCYKRRLYIKQKQEQNLTPSISSTTKNIYCPDLTNWVSESTCQRCKEETPSMWRACQELRKQKPNSKVFNPSKPKLEA